ncbi:lipid A 3-O-deacylase [bacterium BMS3Bbin14]|nr:lipid A 3-O-deacylase [bacterium BMS3Abin13]GBE53679.1 lipid A 3-O-deacylase [bacterium BMS3Bbin14]HDK43110.1 acyloxyacyl hydrolase [Desulfobacteraceae bacterium]HDL98341.1 acyloxyacyl hydrolase [Desulfobacteraceae bacterium]HDO30628.1 acyloxyacyl hydrolase [Desulfobacteraceae bacterium]
MTIRHAPHVWTRNPVKKTAGTVCFLLLFFFVASAFFRVDSARAAIIDTSKDSSWLIGGYGQSIPGWGQTTQRVETIDLVYRYNHLIFDNIGSGWYRGFHSILIELPFHFVVSPDVSTMIGVNFLACYTFTASEQWRPYIFGGGGPVYSFADIPGMGADLNGNYQFGGGLEYKLNTKHKLLFEFRYHHISNAGRKEPNVPLNSCKVLMGITL